MGNANGVLLIDTRGRAWFVPFGYCPREESVLVIAECSDVFCATVFNGPDLVKDADYVEKTFNGFTGLALDSVMK